MLQAEGIWPGWFGSGIHEPEGGFIPRLWKARGALETVEQEGAAASGTTWCEITWNILRTVRKEKTANISMTF